MCIPVSFICSIVCFSLFNRLFFSVQLCSSYTKGRAVDGVMLSRKGVLVRVVALESFMPFQNRL